MIGTSWYGVVGEPAATVEIHYDTGGSLLTSRRAVPDVSSVTAKEQFLRHVAQRVASERLRTLEDRRPATIDRAIELGYSERERIDEGLMAPREAVVGDVPWPGWEVEMGDTIYLWVSLSDHDVYATGDRQFVSTPIDIVVLT